MFNFSTTTIEVEALKAQLTDARAGALVTFEGWVRNHNEGHDVVLLEYEAMESLAVKEAEKIIAEAKEKFSIYNAVCVHRQGALEIGQLAVWLGVTAAHRDAAFEASRYIIDEIKTHLPIWKKEHYKNGTSGWVNCQCTHPHESKTLTKAGSASAKGGSDE